MQLIERINNIETYTADLRIVVKKIITNNLNEALLYKLTLLELRKTIPQFFYINPQILTNSLNIFKNKDIFILQYPEGGLYSFSVGKIIGIDYNNNIIHNCPTLQGASGSPIILRNDLSVIGLHFGSTNPDKKENNISLNLATSINSIISDLKSIFKGKGNINKILIC